MLQKADSTAVAEHSEAPVEVQAEHVREEPQHPYEVLSRLPKDATPAQQDSAIQAVFHVENTHLSSRPDTLGLPGIGKGHDLKEVDLPQYYRQNFFSNDSLLHPELRGGLYGEAGDPMPYTIRADDTITSLLIGCFILGLLAFAKSRRFIVRQLKVLTPFSGKRDTEMTETTSEFRFQFFLVLQTCLLLSVIAFLYTRDTVGETFMLSSLYQLMAIFFGSFVSYFALKELAYWAVNSVFFGHAAAGRWFKSHIFVVSLEGIAVFPLVMLQSYFDLSTHDALVYAVFVLIMVRILLFYKSYTMFFKQKRLFLQNVLYFCTLEIIPLLSLWGVLATIVDYLKINF